MWAFGAPLRSLAAGNAGARLRYITGIDLVRSMSGEPQGGQSEACPHYGSLRPCSDGHWPSATGPKVWAGPIIAATRLARLADHLDLALRATGRAVVAAGHVLQQGRALDLRQRQ